MKFNLCEDMNISDIVKKSHCNIIGEMKLPEWTKNISCPFCKNPLLDTDLRSICFKLNPSNVGDLCIEFLCSNCQCGDYLYMHSQFKSAKEAVEIITEEKKIDVSKFVVEEEMRKHFKNNSLDVLNAKTINVSFKGE